MIARIEKAKEIIENEEVIPLLIDYNDKNNQELQFQVTKYLVSSIDGLWRCNCPDFQGRGLNVAEGSHLCKHCLAVINYIMINDIEELELLIIENDYETTNPKCPECGNKLTEEYLGECHGHIAKQLSCEHCRTIEGYVR